MPALLGAELARMRDGQFLGAALNEPTGLWSVGTHYAPDSGHPAPLLGRGAQGAELRGVNLGVMLLNLAAMREGGGRALRAFFGDLAAIIERRVLASAGAQGGGAPVSAEERARLLSDFSALTNAFPLGDQDMVNELLAARPSILRVLAPPWNWAEAAQHDDAALRRANFSRAPPCVLHMSSGRFLPGSRKSFDNEADTRWAVALIEYVRHVPLGVRPE